MNLAPSIDYTATSAPLSNGLRGVRQTLTAMRQMVRDGRVDPVIRQAAISIIFLTPEKDEIGEAKTLFNFVRDSVRYVRDVHEVETLVSPRKTLAAMVGDCDDQVTFLCALFEACGYATRFVIAGYSDPQTFEHVYCQVFAGGQWFDCDPTIQNYRFGQSPPNPLCILFEGN